MKKPLLIALLMLPLLSVAQQKDATKSKTITHQSGSPSPINPLSLQLEAGTQGIGTDLRYGLYKQLSFRLGVNFIPITVNNAFNLPGFQSTNSANISFYNVHFLADVVPFKKARGFRIVGGAAYVYKGDGGINVIPTGSYTYGNTTVTGTDIGTLNMDVSWKGIAPYAGFGFFKSFPYHLFNFNLDIGTYYLNQPSTHIIGTGLLAPNNQLEPQFNSNLKDDRWLPVIQLNFNFRIK